MLICESTLCRSHEGGGDGPGGQTLPGRHCSALPGNACCADHFELRSSCCAEMAESKAPWGAILFPVDCEQQADGLRRLTANQLNVRSGGDLDFMIASCQQNRMIVDMRQSRPTIGVYFSASRCITQAIADTSVIDNEGRREAANGRGLAWYHENTLGCLLSTSAKKREAGENPARSRHCKQRVLATDATVPKGMGRLRRSMTCKSGNLPRK